MTSGVGHFDQLGNPCLKFHLCGVAHPLPGVEFEGIIDTGYSGFVQLPMQHAFSLKLPLEGTTSYVLADGTKGASITALARTSFGGKTVVGVITLAPGSQEVLVGMDFLRQFKMGIVMAAGGIVLIDEEEIEKFRESRKAKQKKPPAGKSKDIHTSADSGESGPPTPEPPSDVSPKSNA
jgi:predicted aspartyl protease